MELKAGAVVATRFRLVRELGKGGMGAVWLAQHTALDIPCAVKFIHAQAAQNPEARARFEREAKAAAALRSPFVVQILDHGVFEGTPYIAMEYLEGQPLNVRLRKVGRLDPRTTFHIVSQVGRALSKAHSVGVVHRDLKPENVFLVSDEDTEITKVLDFGVAKQTSDITSATQTGALLGTPKYMSPEQAQGSKSVDARADLWSLGVLTYRCLTGKLPFDKDVLLEVLLQIVSAPLPVPSHEATGIPAGFDQWWLRAAQRDPAQRFQSAKEMIDALAVALNLSLPTDGDLTPDSLMRPSGLPRPNESLTLTTPMNEAVGVPSAGQPVAGAPGAYGGAAAAPSQVPVNGSYGPGSANYGPGSASYGPGSAAAPAGSYGAAPPGVPLPGGQLPGGQLPGGQLPDAAAATMGGVLKGSANAPTSNRRVVLGVVVAALATGGLLTGLFFAGVFGDAAPAPSVVAGQRTAQAAAAAAATSSAQAASGTEATASTEATSSGNASTTASDTGARDTETPTARATVSATAGKPPATASSKSKTQPTAVAKPPIPSKPKPTSTRPNLGF